MNNDHSQAVGAVRCDGLDRRPDHDMPPVAATGDEQQSGSLNPDQSRRARPSLQDRRAIGGTAQGKDFAEELVERRAPIASELCGAGGVLHVLSLGAGVQSSTMALMAAAGELTPMPSCAIFADTQAEPASVYKWLDWLEKQLPFPVVRVTKGSLIEAALTVRTSKGGNKYTNSNVPAFLKTEGVVREGLQMRQCTRDFKIDVILREVRKIAKTEIAAWKKDKTQQPPVIQWIGISRDEVYRMKPSRLPYIGHIWPLVDRNITRARCVMWMAEHGFPQPPRSACVMCPYHGDFEWMRLQEAEPEEFEKAAKFEDDYQGALSQIQRRSAVPFLHRSMKPLREIDFAALVKDRADIAAQQPDFFGNECEGMCGV